MYSLLKKTKGKRSFSEAIKERFGKGDKKKSIMNLFGSISDKDAEELRKASETLRKNFKARKIAGL